MINLKYLWYKSDLCMINDLSEKCMIRGWTMYDKWLAWNIYNNPEICIKTLKMSNKPELYMIND